MSREAGSRCAGSEILHLLARRSSVRRTLASLVAACLLASACQEALPAPLPTPAPSAPVLPAPTTLETRIPAASDLRVELPLATRYLDASGGTLFGMRDVAERPRGFQLIAATPPGYSWRVVYTSAADATATSAAFGNDARRTFIESTFGGTHAAFEVVTVDVSTGSARPLDRSTVSLGMLSRLSQRARPTVVGSADLVAWTRVLPDGDGFLWELYETAARDPDASPRLVRRSDQPLVPLAFDGRLAYAAVGPERDELWVYDRMNGEQTRWPTTAAGITGAAWSEAGLIVATIDMRALGATNAVAFVDERGRTRPIVNATPCARPTVSGRYLAWSCPGGTDLRAYDLRSGTFPLVARSPGAYDFHASGDAFVWTEGIAGKNTARVLVLALARRTFRRDD